MIELDLDNLPLNFKEIVLLLEEMDEHIKNMRKMKQQIFNHARDNLNVDLNILKEVLQDRRTSPETLEIRRLMKKAYGKAIKDVSLPVDLRNNIKTITAVVEREDVYGRLEIDKKDKKIEALINELI